MRADCGTLNSEVRTDVASVDPGAGIGAGLWALQTGVLAIDALLFPLISIIDPMLLSSNCSAQPILYFPARI